MVYEDERLFGVSELRDEATDEIISHEKKSEGVLCDEDDIQVMNIKVEDLRIDLYDKVRFSVRIRLNHKFRKQLKIVLLGCHLKIITHLKTTSERSVRSLLQKRLSGICKSNYVISIRMFYINIIQLLNTCKWINYIEDVHPICTLYHVRDDVTNYVSD
ncbi:U1 protein [Black medic leaf roll virus]|uniref:U1 protein n=1 Tax=Black medic leaf roll virus TaxID=2038729 RepID=V9TN92_9VIRU|nr:U1 protein [Black medic leaf roll virus]